MESATQISVRRELFFDIDQESSFSETSVSSDLSLTESSEYHEEFETTDTDDAFFSETDNKSHDSPQEGICDTCHSYLVYVFSQ